MIKNILISILTIFIISVLISLILTELGKYEYHVKTFSGVTFLSLFTFYIALTLIIQFITGFWLIYYFSNYLLIKKINKFIVAFLAGLATFLISIIIAYFKIKTYYYDPDNNLYQIWVFFLAGFLYPYLSSCLKLFLQKK